MFEIRPMVNPTRLVLLCSAWLAALTQVVFGSASHAWINIGVIGFAGFVILTLPRLRRDTVLVLLLLVVVGWFLLDQRPNANEWWSAGRYVLIFAALLPTMALVRATASTMPSVRRTQQSLAQLPASASASGFHFAANIFGSVINTGSLAILSAAVPPDADAERRRLAAESALRGMVTAAAWSPFFIAFAIGQTFTDKANSWISLGIGVVTTILFALVSLPVLTKSFSVARLSSALGCLKPVTMRLIIVLGMVLAVAIIFDFTALSAVVVVMPLLVAVQFFRHPRKISTILTETKNSMIATADDILIITMAMLIGYFAIRTGAFSALVTSFYDDVIPGYVAIILTPLGMMLASVVGVHPVISSTAMLAVFSGGHADAHPALLMQAHLIGWGAGTMSSVASLSVITCANLFKVPSRQLVLGPNLLTALAYALVGGIILSVVNLFV
ncbi:MAG: hypothetical protein VX106_02765 [Pseudomonadota bacterium]|nr:hypothetical protein [Pseudomonadota bacterium]